MTVLRPGEHPDELISASLTGDLSVSEQEALTSHLATCARCRDTLAAFGEERRLISGMRHLPPPRDLGARVRAGIESGRSGALPWWQRLPILVPATGVLAVAAALLAVVVLSNVRGPELAQGTPGASAQPSAVASSSIEPSASVAPSQKPLPTATVNPQAFLKPGELGYFSMTGGPFEEPRLEFIKNDTNESVLADTPNGPPVVAALSPDGEWVAYITEIGESGANQVWALHLTDGETVRLGCAAFGPFADRLLWSADSHLLAYTLPAVDLGSSLECGAGDPSRAGMTDVWVFRTDSGDVVRITDSGDAFAADIGNPVEGATPVMVSHAAEAPWTDYVWVLGDLGIGPDVDESARIDGVFLPLRSPIGGLAVYWTGSMSQSVDGAWQFTTGGLPEFGPLNVSGEPEGTPLFADLTSVREAGFENGQFAWGQDGNVIAFWGGIWNGTPQSEDYPSFSAAYAGRVTDGGLTKDSRLDIPTDAESGKIVSVAFQPDGVRAVVSIRDVTAGAGDPASAKLYIVHIDSGEAIPLGGAMGPTPWDGPAVFGPEPGSPF